jgi:hypothetical protein
MNPTPASNKIARAISPIFRLVRERRKPPIQITIRKRNNIQMERHQLECCKEIAGKAGFI